MDKNKTKALIIVLTILGVFIIAMLVVFFAVGSSSGTSSKSGSAKQNAESAENANSKENTNTASGEQAVDLSDEASGSDNSSNSNKDTPTPTQAESSSENSLSDSSNAPVTADNDTNFIHGVKEQEKDGVKYTISSDSKQILKGQDAIYTTSGNIKKFNVVNDSLAYVIEQSESESNHYYFKKVLLSSGKTVTLWHYISAYVMEDFLISPSTFDSDKTYYILFTASNRLLVLKIVNYNLEKQLSTSVSFDSVKTWYKEKDKDAVKIILNTADGTDEKEFDFSNETVSLNANMISIFLLKCCS